MAVSKLQDIINRYKAYTAMNNLTQAQASEKIGCSQEHLSRIFRGLRRPSMTLLENMLEVLDNEPK